MPLDTSIPLGVRTIQLDDPNAVQVKQLQLRSLMMQNQQAEQAAQQERALNQAYAGSVGADGKLDRAGLLGSLAQGGLGSRIPGLQKQFVENDTAQAKLDKEKFEFAKAQVDATNSAVSTLLAQPQVGQGDVINKIAGMVQSGLLDPERGAQIARSIPPDEGRLRQWLTAMGMQAVEASKRMELLAPKFQSVNTGQETKFVDTNPYTNPDGPGALQMSTTPDANLSAQTARRGQDLSAQTARRGQDLSASTGAGAIETDANGNMLLVDKRTGAARPVMSADGKPVAGKGSNLTEDQAKATAWLVQANNAWGNMQKALAADPGAGKYGIGDAVGSLPLLGGVGRSITGGERQKFNQAAASLSEAFLRAATGAGVNESEAKQKIAELTPQFGDDAETRKQKLAAIPLYLEGLRVRAGPGAKRAESEGLLKKSEGGATGGWDAPAGWKVTAN